ncbi:MAG: carbohydrate ABC transporter permease [Chloroflexota bacterium]|nr:carbohydrate ABC transporter permease [Chloroflexota bacterium]
MMTVKLKRGARIVGFYAALTAGLVIFLLPVLWMVSTSFMRRADVLSSPVKLLPPVWRPQNYREIFLDFNLGHYFLNSIFVTGSIVVLNVLFCSMVGYSLAKFDFPGKKLVFGFILSTIMVPFAAILIPLYLIIREFDWVNTYQALIVPFSMSGLGIFLMRQFMFSIPDDYIDAARVDGATEFGIFFRIVLPLCGPALSTLAILTFVTYWDEFLWPLVVTTTDDYRPLTVGLAKFLEQYQTQWNLLMAGAVVAALPVVLLFLVLQRKFFQAMGGLSGLK